MAQARLDAAVALELIETALAGRSRYAVPLQRGPRLRLEAAPGAPDQADPASVAAWVGQEGAPTAVDLFCGAGGLSLGLHQAGFRVLVGADSDPWSVETHVANLGGLGYNGDLSNPDDFIQALGSWGIRTVDLVAGGVPCQPFSRAGQAKIRSLVSARIRPQRDRRATLWESFVEIIKYLQPRAVVLENVPDLAQWDNGAVLAGFSESLRGLGYQTHTRILNAFEHGVPQHRSRLFIVGARGKPYSAFAWPLQDKASPSLWDAISDLPEVPPSQRADPLHYPGPITNLQQSLRSGMKPEETNLVWDHITRDVRPDDAEAFALLPEGGTYLDIPDRLRRYRSDIFTDKYKRLTRVGLSRTITAHIAKDGYWYIHPTQDRTLSVREAARIQTFPDWFRFAGEPSHRLRQIGNAVPPMLAEAIGRSLRAALMEEVGSVGSPTVTRALARESLVAWHAKVPKTHPWRPRASPWDVMLGEMCFSRVPARRVADAFARLRSVASSPEAVIAETARVGELLELEGMGARLRPLQNIAQALVDSGGGVPSTRRELMAIPHVGDYLASAVLCFGFGQASPLLNINTERVTHRIAGGSGLESHRWQTRLDLHSVAGGLGPDPEFNHALLDLGTLLCRPGIPTCGACPLRNHCHTARRGG